MADHLPWFFPTLDPLEAAVLQEYIQGKTDWVQSLKKDLNRLTLNNRLAVLSKIARRLGSRIYSPNAVFKPGDGARIQEGSETVPLTVISVSEFAVVALKDVPYGHLSVPALERTPENEVILRRNGPHYLSSAGFVLELGRWPLLLALTSADDVEDDLSTLSF